MVRSYDFEWDENKARINEGKHGVTFEEAKTCFADVFAIESFDADHSTDEDRHFLMGRSDRNHVLVIAFTVRRDTSIRIISARRSLRRERLEYEKQIESR